MLSRLNQLELVANEYVVEATKKKQKIKSIRELYMLSDLYSEELKILKTLLDFDKVAYLKGQTLAVFKRCISEHYKNISHVDLLHYSAKILSNFGLQENDVNKIVKAADCKNRSLLTGIVEEVEKVYQSDPDNTDAFQILVITKISVIQKELNELLEIQENIMRFYGALAK